MKTHELCIDMIHNGQASGDAAEMLVNANFDVGALRPWWDPKKRRTYVAMNQGGKQVVVPYVRNTNYTLRQEDWKAIDSAVLKAAKPRLRAVQDLRDRGLVYNLPNGMAHTVLQTELVSDINDATVSMDPLEHGVTDRPIFEPITIPLPVIHYTFYYSARQIAASRNGGSPLDTTTAELAARKVAEAAEKMTLGKWTPASYQWGGGTITGYTNFADVLTKTITSPAVSFSGATHVQEVLAMMQQSRDAYYYGPWMLYHSPNWAQYLDRDYSTTKGDNTVRDRIKMIDGIEDVKQLDYLTGYELLLVQMTSDVVRLIDGLPITTVQWDSHGGMRKNFAVMALWVPQMRSDINDRTGIVYGSV